MKQLTYYINIIEFLIKEQGKTLEQAIKETKVPCNLLQSVKNYFSDRVEIRKTSILKEDENIIRKCIYKSNQEVYFSDFERFLYDIRKWKKSIIENLSDSSKRLLECLPDPKLNQTFESKGLVVGHIQSGKTANITALIARAADHGYRFFIILAGRFRDLRLQTQNRIDQELTGESEIFDYSNLVYHEEGTPKWHRITIADIDGDFQRGSHNPDPNPDTPKIAVIKKNTSIMEKVIKWLKRSTIPIGHHFPTLIIDDECDEASVDTNYLKDGHEPAKTNAKIRKLLGLFEKYTYIGFTATPFANVLIAADVPEDLYPKNFIISLDEPEEYFGARQLFGLGTSPSELSEDESHPPELDVIRKISQDEIDDQIKKASKKASEENKAPDFIQKSILSFVISSCARMARDQSHEHFSMLIHTSHLRNMHKQDYDWVKSELDYLKEAVKYPTKNETLIFRARSLWEDDFCKTTEQTFSLNFEDIWIFAKSILDSIEIILLHYGSDDRLEYEEKPQRRYIIIGGNKLSRGLTLEGLNTSVFFRGTKQYDTLLQMGRWFGYRKGYDDLTRIYVTPEYSDHFADLARVELELRNDLKKYARMNKTPLEIKPIIRAHHTLQVTSPLKMGAGETINVSLQGATRQTIAFPLDNFSLLKKNIETTKLWLKNLSTASVIPDRLEKESYVWENITSDKVIELINEYEFSKEATLIKRDTLKTYIENQNKNNELTNWVIYLPTGPKNGNPFVWIPNVSTKKIVRQLNKRISGKRTAIRVLTEPKHIKVLEKQYDLESNPKYAALIIYVIDKTSGEGSDRALFPDKTGEDIIGLAFKFPFSQSNATAEWVTQENNLF